MLTIDVASKQSRFVYMQDGKRNFFTHTPTVRNVTARRELKRIYLNAK